MKHAYLIIAHNEPEILQLLINALDDSRNDIYIHIDKKASFDGSGLRTQKSKLTILSIRIDARWGDFSLVEVEMALFEEAYKQNSYIYYHLLSGVDLPVRSQDHIHNYCKIHLGTEFIGFAQNVTEKELQWRSQHYFIFARDFKNPCLWKRVFRALFVQIQNIIGYRRIRYEVKKGSQWCSVTHEFVGYLLSCKETIYKNFNHTYCPDELFIQTLCWNSRFRKQVHLQTDEFASCKRYIKWVDGTLIPITMEDVPGMITSDCWFARKFDHDNMEVVNAVLFRS